MVSMDEEIDYSARQGLVERRESMSAFRQEVLEKLGRLEAKMDMLAGNGQPGRMKLAEDRIHALEQNDVRRGVYDRLVTAAIAFAISIAVALHDHLGLK